MSEEIVLHTPDDKARSRAAKVGRPLSDPALGRPLTSTERATKSRKRLYVRREEIPPPISEADQQALDGLKTGIEKLGHRTPMTSLTWGTHRDTVNIVFDQFGVLPEGSETRWSDASAQDVAWQVFNHVAAYRQSIAGVVDLVWRRYPEIDRSERGVRITTRLCFEPTLVQVAQGVWVEVRLVFAKGSVNG